ncbi:MAG: 30S ribosomal protein S17 [Candidatus Acidiferrales bacterium]
MASEAAASAAQAPKERGARQELVGVVTSSKMHKTIVVKVARTVQHRKYLRVIRSSKKYYAHDERNEAKPGDTVRIIASRPLSKLKRWRLAEIVARSTRVA